MADGRAAHGEANRERGAGELEDPRRELQRVPPLPDRSSRARRRRPDVPQGPRLRGGARRLGVSIEGGGVGYTATGATAIPVMPGLTEQQASSMYGASIFPNMFLDLTGTVAIATRIVPRGPQHTTMITDYLFRPEVIDEPGFDPTETVEFSELVAHQDYVICERAQQGVRSRAFTHGTYAE